MRVAVVGSTGYIGVNLVSYLDAKSIDYIEINRLSPGRESIPSQGFYSLDFSDTQQLSDILESVDTVVYLSSLCHGKSSAGVPLESQFYYANVHSLRLFISSILSSKVKHFIYLSSLSVYGSCGSSRLDHRIQPKPSSLYGVSKLFAEDLITQSFAPTSIRWTILRPPLVYGPNEPGNFSKLIKLCSFLPIVPLRSVRARKSLISVFNLVDIIYTCILNESVDSSLFLVSDDCDLAMSELLLLIFSGLSKRSFCLLPFPVFVFSFLSWCFGFHDSWLKLISSSTIDCSHFKETFGWRPVVSPFAAIPLSASVTL